MDGHEFKTNLSYIMSFRPAWAAETVSQNKWRKGESRTVEFFFS